MSFTSPLMILALPGLTLNFRLTPHLISSLGELTQTRLDSKRMNSFAERTVREKGDTYHSNKSNRKQTGKYVRDTTLSQWMNINRLSR